MSGEMLSAAMLLKHSIAEAITPRRWLTLIYSGTCKLNSFEHKNPRYTIRCLKYFKSRTLRIGVKTSYGSILNPITFYIHLCAFLGFYIMTPMDMLVVSGLFMCHQVLGKLKTIQREDGAISLKNT